MHRPARRATGKHAHLERGQENVCKRPRRLLVAIPSLLGISIVLFLRRARLLIVTLPVAWEARRVVELKNKEASHERPHRA